jgi:hypothetical protein
MAVYQSLTPGSWDVGNKYRASSDGFVLCTINRPDDAGGMTSVACGYSSTQGVHALTTGGLTASGPYMMSMNMNSSLLPVYQGNDFFVGVFQNVEVSTIAAPVDFWWISTADATLVQQSKSPDPDFTPPPLPQMDPAPARNRQAFLAILEKLLGKPIDGETQEQLLGLGPLF